MVTLFHSEFFLRAKFISRVGKFCLISLDKRQPLNLTEITENEQFTQDSGGQSVEETPTQDKNPTEVPAGLFPQLPWAFAQNQLQAATISFL